MQPLTNTPELICISSDNGIATYNLNGFIEQAEIQEDQDGEYYYLVNSKAYYLPRVFQRDLLID